MHSVEGGRTYADSQDFASYHQNTVAIQHGTPLVARTSGKGVSIAQLATGNNKIGKSRERGGVSSGEPVCVPYNKP